MYGLFDTKTTNQSGTEGYKYNDRMKLTAAESNKQKYTKQILCTFETAAEKEAFDKIFQKVKELYSEIANRNTRTLTWALQFVLDYQDCTNNYTTRRPGTHDITAPAMTTMFSTLPLQTYRPSTHYLTIGDFF